MMPNRSHAIVFDLALFNVLDVGAICLAEQIKAPEDRQRLVGCAGIIAGTWVPILLLNEDGPPAIYCARFIGANAGEIYNLCRAIKQRKFKNHIRSLSKSDVAAFVVKNLLVTAPVFESLPLTIKVGDLLIDGMTSVIICQETLFKSLVHESGGNAFFNRQTPFPHHFLVRQPLCPIMTQI